MAHRYAVPASGKRLCCSLGYTNEVSEYGDPRPTEPCPKPQQWRTFEKSPAKYAVASEVRQQVG
jgi:hypothetical protein